MQLLRREIAHWYWLVKAEASNIEDVGYQLVYIIFFENTILHLIMASTAGQLQ